MLEAQKAAEAAATESVNAILGEPSTRRLGTSSAMKPRRRELKAAGKGAAGGAAAAEGGTTSEQLKVEQMLGTFMFHWVMMFIALAVGCWSVYYNKRLEKNVKKKVKKAAKDASERLFISTRTARQSKAITEASTRCTGETQENSSEDRDGREDQGAFPISGVYTSNNQAGVDQCINALSQELMEMRRSQVIMEQFQRQLLEEQRSMQRQMQSILGASVPTNGTAREQTNRTSRAALPNLVAVSAATGTVSGADSTIELTLPP